jgi:hypothetical protein
MIHQMLFETDMDKIKTVNNYPKIWDINHPRS